MVFLFVLQKVMPYETVFFQLADQTEWIVPIVMLVYVKQKKL